MSLRTKLRTSWVMVVMVRTMGWMEQLEGLLQHDPDRKQP